MLALKNLIRVQCLYSSPKEYMQSSSNLDVQFNTQDNLNTNNFEKNIEDSPSETLVHNFLNSNKIQDFNNMLSVAPRHEYLTIRIF